MRNSLEVLPRLHVNVRPASVHDASDIRRVHQNAVRVLSREDYTPDQIKGWIGNLAAQNYVDSMEGGEHLWVAELEGQVVGFAGRKGAEITAVYVDPAYARQGIGHQLLRVVEESLADADLNTVYLDAPVNAVPFYTSLDYTVLERRTHRLQSGVEISCVRMEKQLRG